MNNRIVEGKWELRVEDDNVTLSEIGANSSMSLRSDQLIRLLTGKATVAEIRAEHSCTLVRVFEEYDEVPF